MGIGEILEINECTYRHGAIFCASYRFLYEIERAAGLQVQRSCRPEPDTLQKVQPPFATVPSRLGQSKPASIKLL